MNTLSNCHPITAFIYLFTIIIITMFVNNPILIAITLISSITYYFVLSDSPINKRDIIFNTSLFLIIAITNPLFSHNGSTILFYINNNRITLEAMLYGVNIGCMIIAIIYWFKCFNIIISEEKIIYLFSKISPKLALTISSILKFIPEIKRQSKLINRSQETLGLYCTDNLLDRIKSKTRNFSAVTTWALERAIEKSQSMDARGYGIKGRTHYSNYKLRLSDFLTIILSLIIVTLISYQIAIGYFEFSFYPRIEYSKFCIENLTGIFAFALLCLIPTINEIRESLKWKYYKSKI